MEPRSHAFPVLLVAGVVVATGSSSCGDNADPPMTKILETEHFVVMQEGGAAAGCTVLGDWLEGYYSSFESFLDVHRQSSRKLTYKVYTHAGAARSQCYGSSGNCYFPSQETIITTALLDAHELGHVFENLVGTPAGGPRVFSEGIATLLGGPMVGRQVDHRVDTSVAIEDLLGDDAFSDAFQSQGVAVLYPAAAAFVHFLIQRYGKEAFLSFYGSLDGAGSAAAIKQRFNAQFGENLTDVIGQWHLALPPFPDEVMAPGPACSLSPSLPPDQDTSIDPECLYRGFGLEVPASGRLDLVVEKAGGLPLEDNPRVVIQSCEGGALNAAPIIQSPLHLAIDVPPGRYVGLIWGAKAMVRLETDQVSLNDDVACQLERIPAKIGGPDNLSFAVARRWGSRERHLAFDLEVGSAGRLQIADIVGGGAFPQTVYTCAEACLSDPDQACDHDTLRQIQLGTETEDVFDRAVGPGERLHFETGPRGDDMAYSLRVSVAPVAP